MASITSTERSSKRPERPDCFCNPFKLHGGITKLVGLVKKSWVSNPPPSRPSLPPLLPSEEGSTDGIVSGHLHGYLGRESLQRMAPLHLKNDPRVQNFSEEPAEASLDASTQLAHVGGHLSKYQFKLEGSPPVANPSDRSAEPSLGGSPQPVRKDLSKYRITSDPFPPTDQTKLQCKFSKKKD